jgi:hypothetical protein
LTAAVPAIAAREGSRVGDVRFSNCWRMWHNARMTSDENKAKRWWRPRFSVRTLLIVVTLVCVYFGAWKATKQWGCPQVLGMYWDGTSTSSPMPFVVVRTVVVAKESNGVHRLGTDRTYYLWLFGHVAKLHGPEHRLLPH